MATFRVVDEDGDYYMTDGDPADRIEQLTAERDEWHRQNGVLRGELKKARGELEQLRAGEPSWRYRAFGPNDEIVLDPGVGERWTLAGLGGWRVERRPVYLGAWELAPDLTEGAGNV